MKEIAYVLATAQEANFYKKKFFKSSEHYEINPLYIGYIGQRWEGFRFKLIIMTPETQHFMNRKMRVQDAEEVKDSLLRRLDKDGVIIYQ